MYLSSPPESKRPAVVADRSTCLPASGGMHVCGECVCEFVGRTERAFFGGMFRVYLGVAFYRWGYLDLDLNLWMLLWIWWDCCCGFVFGWGLFVRSIRGWEKGVVGE